jgi:hypothetical protein
MGTLDGLRGTAKSIIDTFGTSVTITRVTPDDNARGHPNYNVLAGTQAETTSDTTVKGVVDLFRSHEVGDGIRTSDRTLLVAASAISYAPDVDDRVTIGSDTYRIVRNNVIQATDQAAVYELAIRYDA